MKIKFSINDAARPSCKVRFIMILIENLYFFIDHAKF